MECRIFNLGLTDYARAYKFQKDIFEKVQARQFEHALIFCRHFPVITIGRSGNKDNILVNADELNAKSISLCDSDRGGDVTYHGPGQLTVYPVLNLSLLKKDIHWYLRKLEKVVIDLLADFGINGVRVPGYSGVWKGNKKICSLGIAIRRWISFHGLTLNVKEDDLGNFSLIRPCGMDIAMTSMESELKKEVSMDCVRENFCAKFNRDLSLQAQHRDLVPISGG